MPTPNRVGFSVEVAQLAKELRQFGDQDLRKELRQAGKDAAQVIADRAKQLAPVGTAPKRGQRLKDTIKPYATNTKSGVRAGSKKNFHARFVHFGHKKRGSKRGQGHGWVQEQPFITDAIKDKEQEFLDIYRDRINTLITKYERRKK